MRKPRRQCGRFAGTGTREHKHGSFRRQHGVALRGIEA
jgi:hypothetical protein